MGAFDSDILTAGLFTRGVLDDARPRIDPDQPSAERLMTGGIGKGKGRTGQSVRARIRPRSRVRRRISMWVVAITPWDVDRHRGCLPGPSIVQVNERLSCAALAMPNFPGGVVTSRTSRGL